MTKGEDAEAEAGVVGDRHIGDDPDSGMPVYVRNGPYGPYVQLGDLENEEAETLILPKGHVGGGGRA